jgi:hypothetical protein
MSAVSYRRASCVAPHLLHIRATIFVLTTSHGPQSWRQASA